MIKGPYKYDEHTLFITKLFGFIFALIAIALKTRIGEWSIIISIPSVIVAVLIYAVFYAIGQVLAYRSRALLHTVVKNRITNIGRQLEINQFYWLNGRTKVRYVKNSMENTGKHEFASSEIEEIIELTPDQVRTYLSKTKES